MTHPRRLAVLGSITAVYFVAGRFGLSLAFVNTSASAVWPPTGIAIAAGLIAGAALRPTRSHFERWDGGVWPAVLLGAFLVNLSNTGHVIPSAIIACGNTLEMLAAVVLVRGFAGGIGAFSTTPRLLIYVLAAALASAIAATVGLAALLIGDLAGPSPTWMVWLTWWTGDLSGALLVAPAVVTWVQRPVPVPPSQRLGEALLLLAALCATAFLVFGPTPAGTRHYPVMFFLLPMLLWASVRFGLRGATGAMLMIATIAIPGTLQGLGPFARGVPNESLLLLQAYLCVTAVVMGSLAAEVGGRRLVEQEIRELNADLARRVEARAEELRRLHGHFVAAQEVAHVGSWEWDVAADTIWWSDEMYRVYRVPIGTPITFERFVSLLHPDDRQIVQEVVRRSGQTGEPFTLEHRAVTPDGVERVLHARGRVVLDEHGRLVRMLGVGHDITERHQAEEERLQLVREQAARREAEEASRMKDDFLATLSHELRTPMNAILGWSQMLRDRALDEATRWRAAEAIHRNVLVQAQLVSDILDVARIRSGTLKLELRPVALRSIVGDAIEVLRQTIESKRIAVTVDIPADTGVIGDAQRLQQVFWNVLANAAKFAPTGGHIGVRSMLDDRPGVVAVTIEDDGPGIAEEFLPFVFEQFTQADPSVTREHGGLGLGLAISQTLVRLHGGTIAAANRPEGGAILTIRLPGATEPPPEPSNGEPTDTTGTGAREARGVRSSVQY